MAMSPAQPDNSKAGDSSAAPEKKIPPLPPADEFLIRIPLYEFYSTSDAKHDELVRLFRRDGHLDAYCIWCEQPTVFHRTSPTDTGVVARETLLAPRVAQLVLTCARSRAHSLKFWFLVSGELVGKIGQWPSVADLNMAAIGKYRKVLGEERYRELSRALGLAAHGVGIGSFVYLRRIFEGLIEKARAVAAKESGFDNEAFENSRMDDRILLLRAHLPAFLVENRALYGIMSKGIHSFFEEECLRYFDTVRTGIEFILDEEVEKRMRVKKLAEAAAAIAKARGEVAGA